MFAKGGLAGALFVLVMSANAFPNGSRPIKLLMPIRGEMSIMASILAMSHIAIYGSTQLKSLFGHWGSIAAATLISDIMSFGLVLLLIPLFVTSFKKIREKMAPKTWKKLQRWAYLFYALIFGHIIFFTGKYALLGRAGYRLNLAVYSFVFLTYAVCRIMKHLHIKQKRTDKLYLRQMIGAVLIAAIVLLLTVTVIAGNAPVHSDVAVSVKDVAVKPAQSDTAAPEPQAGSDPSESSAYETDNIELSDTAGVPEDAPDTKYTDGTYTGSAFGNSDNITVQITIKDDIITGVEILSQNEDEPYFSDACAVIDDILSTNSTDVDTVSGATFSSGGILDAVSKALEAAKRP
ncbi:MAG: FMN-binding protein [Lachnospiraceae bacterium]|nr:FMN-binding protein [Lachnospiraceae bacterium]